MRLLKLARRLLKKRVVWDVLSILYDKKNVEMRVFDLLKELNNIKSYYNAYLRVKDALILNEVIGYKLDIFQKKMVYLTKKGIQFAEYLETIEILMGDEKNG